MSSPIVVAVTKQFPYETVKKAVTLGYTHIGENRVEEAKEKISQAEREGLRLVWHMIGHVQSRKVKDVVMVFDRIDSVDSIELLKKINSEAKKIGKIMHVLLEINISGEESKYGFRNVDASTLRGFDASNIVIDGLMTMAPYTTTPEDNRKFFRSLRELSNATPSIGNVLSMGTSCDYKVAIEEGATEVRLGEGLFGKRSK